MSSNRLENVSPFRRASSVSFPKKGSKDIITKTDIVVDTPTESSVSDTNDGNEVLSATPSVSALTQSSQSSQFSNFKQRKLPRSSMSVMDDLRVPNNTNLARRPSTEPSGLSWAMFNIGDLLEKARQDVIEERRAQAESARAESSSVKTESTSTATDSANVSVSSQSALEEIPKPGSLSAAAKVYPSMVEDERWFDEPWRLISLREESQLITLSQAQLVAAHMPLRYRAGDWELVYSTYRDGISLHTLYRKAGNATGPDVLIIKDTDGGLFGGFTTDSVCILDQALFSFHIHIQIFFSLQ